MQGGVAIRCTPQYHAAPHRTTPHDVPPSSPARCISPTNMRRFCSSWRRQLWVHGGRSSGHDRFNSTSYPTHAGHGTRNKEQGTWDKEHGTWDTEHGTDEMRHGIGYMSHAILGYGKWSTDHGTWNMGHGIWDMEYGTLEYCDMGWGTWNIDQATLGHGACDRLDGT